MKLSWLSMRTLIPKNQLWNWAECHVSYLNQMQALLLVLSAADMVGMLIFLSFSLSLEKQMLPTGSSSAMLSVLPRAAHFQVKTEWFGLGRYKIVVL